MSGVQKPCSASWTNGWYCDSQRRTLKRVEARRRAVERQNGNDVRQWSPRTGRTGQGSRQL